MALYLFVCLLLFSTLLYPTTFFTTQELQDHQKNNLHAFWHLHCPTTGIVLENSIDNTTAYVPHLFTLWQLAPKKGADITIALFDTGVAAFESNDSWCKQHPQLLFPSCYLNNYLNITRSYELESLIKYIQELCDAKPTNAQVANWITEYCLNSNKRPIIDFVTQQKKPLNLVDAITNGRRGINPGGIKRFFSPIQLQKPATSAIVELLPLPFSTYQNDIFCSHGTHMYGLINAQAVSNIALVGIAPNAQCIMYKICKEQGVTDTTLLLKALQEARTIKPDIINFSLKINETNKHILDALAAEITHFNYSIAASGNESDSVKRAQLPYSLTQLSITWLVGAFEGKNNTIAPFSQHQKGVGPHFVAPGFDIISTGVRYQKYAQENGYLSMSGTSIASALMAGFLALILAEFQDDFTKEQLLCVCIHSAAPLSQTAEWFECSLYGAIDMRTALFMLWVLRAIKEKKIVDVENNFEHIVISLKNCLKQEVPIQLLAGKKVGLDMTVNYYVRLVINNKSKIKD